MKKQLFVMAAMLLTSTAMLCSCGKDKEEKVDTSKEGLYVGIVGFNDDLHTKSLKLLNDASKQGMEDFINGLEMQNGTVLYHAVNTALDKIEEVTAPEDLINVSIVTFTDGLDLGSYVLNENYNSGNEYLNALETRIHNEQIEGVPISAYSIGVRGSDVNDVERFRQNLEKLSSNPETNVFEVGSMSQVAGIFANIAQDLYNQSSSYDITLKTPAPEPGSKIRFTFDNVTDANESNLYVEGIYDRENNVGMLHNISYCGLNSCGSVIYAKTEGIFDKFTFSNLITLDGIEVPTDKTKQWDWIASTQTWQNNSECTPTGNTVVTEEFKSALIMLVLDCSSSLSSDFPSMKTAACQFIETLSGNTHQ